MRSTGQVYALKTLNKWEMLKRAEVIFDGMNIKRRRQDFTLLYFLCAFAEIEFCYFALGSRYFDKLF